VKPVIEIHPQLIVGRWRQGYVLDLHTLSSTYLGDDEYGHAVFDTKRSPVGELLYRLKYQSLASVIPELVSTAAQLLRTWNPDVDVVVPVPATKDARKEQPVALLSRDVAAEIGAEITLSCIVKRKATKELKDVFDADARQALLEGAYAVQADAVRGKRVLLMDDLYRSGGHHERGGGCSPGRGPGC